MTEDVTCSCCDAKKPEIAYPTRNGQRNGRVCLACNAERRRHRVRPTTSRTLLRLEAMRTWRCEACGRQHPDVYPNNYEVKPGGSLDRLCRGCTVRARKGRAAA